ncbi:MAG: 6-phosphofructokinase [Bacilli bacterium]|nr:6-phosphofructokinase [Bacilli bacterium]
MSVKRIGVLTSGGDAPGMNAALRAIVKTGLAMGNEMFVIYDGYKGLVEGNIKQVDRYFVSEILTRGGTIIHSARLPEFKEIEVREKGVEQLKKFGIDALVVIGGDGTYQGALALSKMGINCVALPGTIDNDVASSDYTIGFDTALNTICSSVDKLRDTSGSHHRCALIEVMGRYCGDLAMYAGIGCGADIIVSQDLPMTEDEIIEEVKRLKANGRLYVIIVVTELMFDVHALAKRIEEETGITTREEVVGRIQRGGSPSAYDRVLAARMGVYSVELLHEGKTGICIGLDGRKLTYYPIDEALKLPRQLSNDFLDIVIKLK